VVEVAILGAGRFGRTMHVLLARAGINAALVRRGEAVPPARVIWLAVRDGDLREASAAVPDGALTLHASGALAPSVLPPRLRAGVLHPMMTFPGPEVAIPDVQGVPARVDGHPDALQSAVALASRLGLRPLHITDGTRWHAAACMVSGHLAELTLRAATVLEQAGLDRRDARECLGPLARTSLANVLAHGDAALTGPATRGDRTTTEAHLDVLTGETRDIYATLSRAILARAR
jgi:predicted short-subunit dehydrogenase-like oxidoreductase (DUF2520 family)